jgi:hypothetical protein
MSLSFFVAPLLSPTCHTMNPKSDPPSHCLPLPATPKVFTMSPKVCILKAAVGRLANLQTAERSAKCTTHPPVKL